MYHDPLGGSQGLKMLNHSPPCKRRFHKFSWRLWRWNWNNVDTTSWLCRLYQTVKRESFYSWNGPNQFFSIPLVNKKELSDINFHFRRRCRERSGWQVSNEWHFSSCFVRLKFLFIAIAKNSNKRSFQPIGIPLGNQNVVGLDRPNNIYRLWQIGASKSMHLNLPDVQIYKLNRLIQDQIYFSTSLGELSILH